MIFQGKEKKEDTTLKTREKDVVEVAPMNEKEDVTINSEEKQEETDSAQEKKQKEKSFSIKLKKKKTQNCKKHITGRKLHKKRKMKRKYW